MTDHVAVLRVLRDFYSGSVLNHSEKAAAIDHAIATCEERDAMLGLRAERLLLMGERNELREQHAALVARLGELEKVVKFLLGEDELEGLWFGERPEGDGPYWWRIPLRAAWDNTDDLARVVKEGEGD